MRTLLGTAIVLNIVLAIALNRSLVHNRVAAATRAAPAANSPASHHVPPVTRGLNPVPTDDASGWRSWLGQLRAAGVPDKVLAGLVTSDFEERWEKSRRDMQRQFDTGRLDADAMARFVDEHDAAQENELTMALGIDGFRAWDREKVLADLDPQKVALSSVESNALYQLRKDLAQRQRDLAKAHSDGEIDEADFEAGQAEAQADYDKKLKALLGDGRYAALQTPDSGIKGDLTRKLKDLNPTDAQFEAILAAQKQWEDQHAEFDRQLAAAGGGADQQRLQAIDVARDAAYRQALGTNGFESFQKAQDSRYQALERYASAWQLTGENIDHIYNVLRNSDGTVKEYLQRARAMEAQGETVDWPKVEAAVQQFTTQMHQDLRAYLGDDRFDKLQRNDVFASTDDGD